MSQIDRMITTLAGLTSEGEVAQEIASSVEAEAQSIASLPPISAAVSDLTVSYSMGTLAEASSDILSSGGDLSEISAVIERAYRQGLERGLAIGVQTCPERRFPLG